MTRSPGLTPSRMSQRSSMARPRRTWVTLAPVVFADHEHFAPAPVVAAHRLLRHRERIGIDPLLDLNTDIHAGQQRQLRIGKLAAQRHLTGAGIDRGVGEQQLAVVGIDLAVVEDKAHPRRRAVLKRAGLEFAPQLTQLGGRLGEIGVDGIELLDRRHMRRFGLTDQGAFGHESAADSAADRRANPRVFEIEPGARDVRLARGDVRFGLAKGRNRHLQLRRRDRTAWRQRLLALFVLTFLVQHCVGLAQGGFRSVELDLERLGVDLVEHLAFLDVAPLLEIATIDDAGYAGANLGDSGWGNAARQLANDRQRRRLQFDDADFLDGGCSLALGSGGPFAAAGQGPASNTAAAAPENEKSNEKDKGRGAGFGVFRANPARRFCSDRLDCEI